MKNTLIILILINTVLFSQSFTQITEGDIVNDRGYSFGVSWGDLNNDGYPDLYVANGGPDGRNDVNFLYFNNGDGTFTKVTEGVAVTLAEKSNGATLADFDNDGDVDIFVANRNGDNNTLYINNGDKTFTRATGINLVSDGGNTNSGSWTDYNMDGFPDLFAVNFFSVSNLYTNNTDGSFTKFPNNHPAKEINTSISASWADYDNDGDPDLFVANAEGAGKQNLIYNNNGDNTFSLVKNGSISADSRASIGGTWGDFNNDGNLDLFVANQAGFVNDLYINNGDGTFTPLTGKDVVSENSQSINGNFIDIDNDGDLDLYVTNWQNNNNFLYINSGYPDYNLEKNSDNILTEDAISSMGSAWADYDNDGDLDLFIANRNNQNNHLFRNETSGNNWVQFNAEGSVSGKSALVTKFRLLSEIDGQNIWQIREISSQQGYNSQDDVRIHFGLGNADKIDSLIIEWTSGTTEILTDVPINTIHKVSEGSGITDVAEFKFTNEIKNSFDLSQNYPNPFNPTTTIKFTIPSSIGKDNSASKTKLSIYNALGQEVSVLFNKQSPSGSYEIQFNAEDLPSGVYFYRLTSDNYSLSKKMILLK